MKTLRACFLLSILTVILITPEISAQNLNEPKDIVSNTSTPPDSSAMKNTIIGVLIFASVISLFLIVERGLALRQSVIIPFRVVELQGICKTEENLLTLRTTANKIQSPYSRLIACAIDHLHLTREENMEMLQTRARSEVARMERGIVVLEIITGIAPLLGLVGTIFGLITLFQGMGVEASAEQTALFSQGISIALKATLLGLVVAIPSLIGWSYFNRKVETLAIEMENLCDQFLYEQYRNND
tara:strand:+ start:108 stop:836 length:729 start_codon:yes stop_codon:yes gene_type:complete